jgi:hypothetical protein
MQLGRFEDLSLAVFGCSAIPDAPVLGPQFNIEGWKYMWLKFMEIIYSTYRTVYLISAYVEKDHTEYYVCR